MKPQAIASTGKPVKTARGAGPEVLLTAAALPVMLVLGLTTPSSLTPAWVVVVTVATWLPLTVRLIYPLPVLVIVCAADSAGIGLAAHHGQPVTTVPIATMVAVFTVAAASRAATAWVAAGAAAAVQFGVALFDHPAGSDWLYLNWVLVAAVIGRLMKERRDRMAAAERRADAAERTRQAEADRQVTAERMRIARELHDVLAHHIAVINTQAGVAEYLLPRDPAAAAAALNGITANSKAALDELRATLGLLRAEGDPDPGGTQAPAPTAGQLDRLLDVFTGAGLQLRVTTRGERGEMSGPAELAYYRIVQEALTNVTKHAPGTDVSLDIEWAAASVQVTVTNTAANGSGSGTASGGSGYGLIGMRERAAAAGGSVTSGPTSEGGYRVTATLPLLHAGNRPAADNASREQDTARP
jgi:signal transduction histidine kinase